jgi:hypothetical protein
MDELLQRLLLAGTLGLAMARRAATILEATEGTEDIQGDEDRRAHEAAVLRAILDGANECTGYFDDRPPGERWCDTMLRLLDLAAFARELGTSRAGD